MHFSEKYSFLLYKKIYFCRLFLCSLFITTCIYCISCKFFNVVMYSRIYVYMCVCIYISMRDISILILVYFKNPLLINKLFPMVILAN